MKAFYLLSGLLICLTACESAPKEETAENAVAGEFGTRCYELHTEKADISLQLVTGEDKQVSGVLQATIHDEANGYYTGYQSLISGSRSGDQLNMQMVTAIEYDVQESEATWTVSGDKLITDIDTLTETSCPAVERFTLNTHLKLYGKWQSADDPKSFMRFKEVSLLEDYEGQPDATSSTGVSVTDSCGHDPVPDGNYISTEDDRCFYIEQLTDSTLELTYTARGNTLRYKRVK